MPSHHNGRSLNAACDGHDGGRNGACCGGDNACGGVSRDDRDDARIDDRDGGCILGRHSHACMSNGPGSRHHHNSTMNHNYHRRLRLGKLPGTGRQQAVPLESKVWYSFPVSG